jgi:Spy/CpxP family protein refolding chaperone
MTLLRCKLLVAMLVVLPALAEAQISGMYPWWDGPIARDLGLTEEQNRQIREVVKASRDHLIELRGTVQKAEAELRDEMNDERVDSGSAEAAIERVVAARSELMRAVSQMSLKLRMILTLSQWQELQRRQNRLPGAPGRRGGPERSLRRAGERN